MGILNVTPDSFSDGGQFADRDAALRQAERMLAEGADIIDVGGESTRPGAVPVPLQQELDRVLPVVEALTGQLGCAVSIDSSKPEVMCAAVASGAAMINDVLALQADGAVERVAELGVPVCLMHMQGEPRSMQTAPRYADVVQEVIDFLLARVQACREAGIAPGLIAVDPGFGFGKRLEDNLALLRNLKGIVNLGYPVVVGMSRKSMIGDLLGRPQQERLAGGLALAVLARQAGASIIRVHDVAPTVDALRVLATVTAN